MKTIVTSPRCENIPKDEEGIVTYDDDPFVVLLYKKENSTSVRKIQVHQIVSIEKDFCVKCHKEMQLEERFGDFGKFYLNAFSTLLFVVFESIQTENKTETTHYLIDGRKYIRLFNSTDLFVEKPTTTKSVVYCNCYSKETKEKKSDKGSNGESIYDFPIFTIICADKDMPFIQDYIIQVFKTNNGSLPYFASLNARVNTITGNCISQDQILDILEKKTPIPYLVTCRSQVMGYYQMDDFIENYLETCSSITYTTHTNVTITNENKENHKDARTLRTLCNNSLYV